MARSWSSMLSRFPVASRMQCHTCRTRRPGAGWCSFARAVIGGPLCPPRPDFYHRVGVRSGAKPWPASLRAEAAYVAGAAR